MSNIEQLRREAIAARVTGWHYGSETLPVKPAPEGWARRVLADIREADADEAREQRRALLEAHTIRCRICHAPIPSGYPCLHGATA